MSISEKYNLGRQNANISALSSGNVSKHEFLSGRDVLPEKGLLEKAVALKRFEYLPLGKELKAQTSDAEKQYEKLEEDFKPSKKEEIIEASCAKSNLVYSNDSA